MGETPNNWIDRRAAREDRLLADSRAVWEGVRAALQDACNSFRKHYEPDVEPPQLVFELENGKRARITRTVVADNKTTYQSRKAIITIAFVDDESPVITSTDDHETKAYKIDADADEAYVVHQQKPISADEISQLILEPLLFPKQVRVNRIRSKRHSRDSWMS